MIKKMKKLFVIAVVLLNKICPAMAESKFAEANKLYEQKKYAEAAAAYGEISVSKNPAVYFNLGNSYFRMNKIGLAILYYERAKRLSPRDEDINFNLRFAKKLVNDDSESIISKFYGYFSSAEMFGFVSVINVFFFLLLYLRVIRKRSISSTFLFIVFSVLLIGFAILYGKLSHDKTPYAIVTVPACELKSGPAGDYKTELTLNEGKKIVIFGLHGEWYYASPLGVGHKGWVEKSSVDKI